MRAQTRVNKRYRRYRRVQAASAKTQGCRDHAVRPARLQSVARRFHRHGPPPPRPPDSTPGKVARDALPTRVIGTRRAQPQGPRMLTSAQSFIPPAFCHKFSVAPMMIGQRIGTPLSTSATRVMLLGAGELGKEVIIALQRLGVEVIAVDRYANAPGHQVAHRSHVIDMTDAKALRALVEKERPHLIVPEIEAIATDALAAIETEGVAEVIPTARATQLTMNREGIRRLAAEELGLPTSPYAFADTTEELAAAADKLGWPVVVKPVMSSSGHGQSLVKSPDELAAAWDFAQSGGRGTQTSRCIVEGFIAFDTEITMLTVQNRDGTLFCDPVFHRQVAGDYAESWQEPTGTTFP